MDILRSRNLRAGVKAQGKRRARRRSRRVVSLHGPRTRIRRASHPCRRSSLAKEMESKV